MPSLFTLLGIDRLSVEERLRLIEEIRDSLESEAEAPPLDEAQERELDRRIAALDADPDAVVAREEVEARVRARLGR
jgi:putative addiction module component (TIGR02574 family)